MERLRHLASPLLGGVRAAAGTGPHGTTSFAREDPEGSVNGLLSTQLQTDAHGTLTPASVAALESGRSIAAQQQDYHSAAALDEFLKVLGPATPDRPLEAYAPAELEAQAKCFETHGFVIIPGMVDGTQLQQLQVHTEYYYPALFFGRTAGLTMMGENSWLQAAWLRLEATAHENWSASGAPERLAQDYGRSFGAQTFGLPFLSRDPGPWLALGPRVIQTLLSIVH
jgi:hypothetical protein